MALPRVNNPTFELELPSTGEKIKYRPFLVKEQKILLIAQESKDDGQIANTISELVTACTFGKVDPKTAPMFDVEYIFLKVRTQSVGSKVEMVVTCPDDGKTTVPVKIDLDDINVTMTDDHTNEVMITDTIKLTFRYPILEDMMDIDANSPEIERVLQIMSKCIQTFEYGDDVYQRGDVSEKEIEDFVGELTTSQFEKLVEFFNTMPKLRHVITVTNPKTKKKNEVVLEGLQSFLE
tara:strand:- start:22 stop:729 length:708 start_codon:yes stop_codon:yes gene_type:complete